jgi:ParB-like chromosome segregation protein Spo0J
MSRLVTAPIGAIDANPFRRLGDYPFVERKLEALQRSIAEVGFWEGVIGRQPGNRIEIAFGHHRVEAARRSGLTDIPVFVRDLTDEQMLQFMGRENMEDYNADFLAMLETWEAAARWLTPKDHAKNTEAVDIARLLGWTRHDEKSKGNVRINDTAQACAAAAALLKGGYISRDDLKDLTVFQAREICGRAQSTIQQLDAMAKTTRRPAAEVEGAKRHVGKAVKETARESRGGNIAQKDLRARVDLNTYRFSRKTEKPSPLFAVFGKQLADSIGRMLNGDAADEKLNEIQKALPQVTLDDDRMVLKRIDYELGELGERTGIWRKRLTPTEKKVTHLQIGGQ